MSDFGRAWAAEIDHLARDRWDQALLLLAPLILLGLMAAMLIDGVPRDLPIGVVGGGGDAVSRSFIRALDESPAVAVVARPVSEGEAQSLVRQGRLVAFVELPPSIDRREQAKFRVSYNAAYLSTGGIAEAGITTALGAAAVEAASQGSGLAGASLVHLPPPPLSINILANPQASFEWYLQALVDPAVLHLLVACVTAMAMGRALEGGSLGAWARASGGGAGALAGKLAPYVLVTSAWGAAWLVWIAGVRGWQPAGSLWLIWGGQAMLLAGTAAISALLVAATRETSTALAVSAIYAGSALAYSGGSLPIEGGSLFARGWSGLLPFSHYLDLQMDQWLGAPAGLATQQMGLLAVYIVVPGALTLLLLARAKRA